MAHKRRRTTVSGVGIVTGAPHQEPLTGVIGKTVFVPASHFGVEVPGMFYRAKVVGRERGKTGAVTLRFFEDDGTRCWLPVRDVSRWLQDGGNGDGLCTSSATDAYAAQALSLLKGGVPKGDAEKPKVGAESPSAPNTRGAIQRSLDDNGEENDLCLKPAVTSSVADVPEDACGRSDGLIGEGKAGGVDGNVVCMGRDEAWGIFQSAGSTGRQSTAACTGTRALDEPGVGCSSPASPHAGVVCQNWRPDVAGRLGVDSVAKISVESKALHDQPGKRLPSVSVFGIVADTAANQQQPTANGPHFAVVPRPDLAKGSGVGHSQRSFPCSAPRPPAAVSSPGQGSKGTSLGSLPRDTPQPGDGRQIAPVMHGDTSRECRWTLWHLRANSDGRPIYSYAHPLLNGGCPEAPARFERSSSSWQPRGAQKRQRLQGRAMVGSNCSLLSRSDDQKRSIVCRKVVHMYQ